jgi:hypothetical protein
MSTLPCFVIIYMFILSAFLLTRRNQTWVLIRSPFSLTRAGQALLFIARQRAVYGAYICPSWSPVLTEAVNATAPFRLNSVNLYVLDDCALPLILAGNHMSLKIETGSISLR